MPTPVAIAAPPKVAFPEASVEARLRSELVQAAIAIATIQEKSVPSRPGDIAAMELDIDSIVVVSILCSVEPIIGFELPEHVVKAGGYKSVESAVKHMVPRIQREWQKKQGVSS